MQTAGKTFKVLNELDGAGAISQRALATRTGISLGQVNYLINQLMEKGFIKIRNFRKSRQKSGYAYILTPRGIEAKSKLAVRFVMAKLKEYNQLKDSMAQRLDMIARKGASQILFIGPSDAKDFIDSIIEEKGHAMAIVHRLDSWRELAHTQHPFDMALLFDESIDSFKEIESVTGVARNQLMALW